MCGQGASLWRAKYSPQYQVILLRFNDYYLSDFIDFIFLCWFLWLLYYFIIMCLKNELQKNIKMWFTFLYFSVINRVASNFIISEHCLYICTYYILCIKLEITLVFTTQTKNTSILSCRQKWKNLNTITN